MNTVEIIDGLLEQCNPSMLQYGCTWYPRAKQLAMDVAMLNGIRVSQARWLATVSVASQRSAWPDRTLGIAVSCWQSEFGGGCMGHVADKITCLKTCRSCQIGNYVRGPKITAFFDALMGDASAVVIDGHMTWILRGLHIGGQRPPCGGGKLYPTKLEQANWTNAIRDYAASLGCEARQLQAILWCAGKRFFPAPGGSWPSSHLYRGIWSYLDDLP